MNPRWKQVVWPDGVLSGVSLAGIAGAWTHHAPHLPLFLGGFGLLAGIFGWAMVSRWRSRADQSLWQDVHQHLPLTTLQWKVYANTHHLFPHLWDWANVASWEIIRVQPPGGDFLIAIPIPTGRWDHTRDIWEVLLGIEATWIHHGYLHTKPITTALRRYCGDAPAELPGVLGAFNDVAI